jgi:hypothetical protein
MDPFSRYDCRIQRVCFPTVDTTRSIDTFPILSWRVKRRRPTDR